MAGEIPAIETGLSSDPAMNWRVPSLDDVAIMSFSDAHSAPNLGRELTVMNGEMTYDGLVGAMRRQDISYTVEFYPEEGKYHHSGHRACRGQDEHRMKCGSGARPVWSCGRPITVGVSYQSRGTGRQACGYEGWRRWTDATGTRVVRPSSHWYPCGKSCRRASASGRERRLLARVYERLIERFGTELSVLMDAPIAEIDFASDERTAEGIERVRRGDIFIEPGYDGVYGTVRVLGSET